LPVQLSNGIAVSWTFRVGVSDVMEDIKLIGGFRFGTSIADKDLFLSFLNLRKRIDWGLTYYRSNIHDYYGFYGPYSSANPKSTFGNNVITNLYQANASFPFDEVKSIRLIAGLRTDKGVLRPYDLASQAPTPDALGLKDSIAKTIVTRLEYVYDNTINPAQNIWNGLRWKIYTDFQVPTGQSALKGKHIFNVGVDARNYLKIYRNFIWATRAAADFSLGEAKVIYYLGGMDGWLIPKYYGDNPPKNNYQYAFQSLAVNMRGFKQNIANGNNNIVLNSELRLPVFTTLFNKPINNAFIRNFQLIQFIDLGTAWEGSFTNITRPTRVYSPDPNTDPNYTNNPIQVRLKAGGLGPLAGGYGFGARSTLLGYFLKFDVGYPMRGLFREPVYYFSMGLDF